jgi:hypothetical protein
MGTPLFVCFFPNIFLGIVSNFVAVSMKLLTAFQAGGIIFRIIDSGDITHNFVNNQKFGQLIYGFGGHRFV